MNKITYNTCLFVCLFQGWQAQVHPLPDEPVFAKSLQSQEFPLHHYSGLGTRT